MSSKIDNTDGLIDSPKKDAQQICEDITLKVVADLQEITDLGFGDETGLANVWEEICVQRQSEESAAWYAYDETVRVLVEAHLENLAALDRDAIWLETEQGFDWQLQDDVEEVDPPLSIRDIVDYIAANHVYPRADDFSNDRITAFLDSREFG
jgi:hypothetical protein